MVHLEVDKQPAGVCGKDAQEDDEDYTRDDTTVQNSERSQPTIASVAFGDPIYEDTHTPLQAKMEVIACLEPFQ